MSALKSNTLKQTTIKTTKINKRVAAGLFIFLFVLSTIASLLMPVAVYAATTAASKSNDMDWKIKSFLYYRTLGKCMRDSSMADGDGFTTGGRIDNGHIRTGEWFGIGSLQDHIRDAPIGVYLKSMTDVGDDGKINCDQRGLVTSALSHWGLDGAAVLCSSGMLRVGLGANQNLNDCISNPGQLERPGGSGINGWSAGAAKFATYIKNQIYGGKEPTLTDPEWYFFYKTTLLNSCIPNIKNRPDSSRKAADNQFGYNDVKWVDVNQTDVSQMVVTGSYTGVKKPSDIITTRPGAEPNYDEVNRSCAESAKLMSDYAPAYARWVQENRTVAQANESTALQGAPGAGPSETSCSIEGVGWIICPALTFLGDMSDDLYAFLAQNFLVINIELLSTSGDNNGTFVAWSVMRNLANIAFVIVFLIIIFSQLSTIGVTNYGVKKLLPRLVIAAILVNISFFICQLAVDLSNVLGYSIKNVFDAIGVEIKASAPPIGTDINGEGFNLWSNIVLLVIAGTAGAAVYGALGSLIAVLLAALIALLVIFFILIIRQVLVVLLITLAPLAFVAYLLPNTENLFTKWRKTFTTLLLVFPIIGLVYGASSLASTILRQVYGDGNEMISQIIAAGVLVIPLVVVPFILKSSLDGIGKIGARINGLGDKLGNGVGKRGEKAFERSRLGQFQKYREGYKERQRGLIQSGVYKGSNRNPLNWGRNVASVVNSKVNDNQSFNKATSGFGLRSAASGVLTAEKHESDEVNAAETLIRFNSNPTDLINDSAKKLTGAIKSGDVVTARAAQKILLNSGNPGISTLYDTLKEAVPSSKEGVAIKASDVVRNLRTDLNASGLKPKNNVLNKWATNNDSFEQTLNNAGTFNALNDVELGGQNIELLNNAFQKGFIGKDQADAIINNANVFKDLDNSKKLLFTELSKGVAYSGSESKKLESDRLRRKQPSNSVSTEPELVIDTQTPSSTTNPTVLNVEHPNAAASPTINIQQSTTAESLTVPINDPSYLGPRTVDPANIPPVTAPTQPIVPPAGGDGTAFNPPTSR